MKTFCGINQKFFAKLPTVGSVIVRGDKIIPPDASEHVGGINVRTKMLNIAHEGYSSENAVRWQIRSRLWFPKMDEGIVKSTKDACHAKILQWQKPEIALYLLIPLKNSYPQNLTADHWGPTADGYFSNSRDWWAVTIPESRSGEGHRSRRQYIGLWQHLCTTRILQKIEIRQWTSFQW